MSDPKRVVKASIASRWYRPDGRAEVTILPGNMMYGAKDVRILEKHPDGVGPVENWMPEFLTDPAHNSDFDKGLRNQIAAALSQILGVEDE